MKKKQAGSFMLLTSLCIVNMFLITHLFHSNYLSMKNEKVLFIDKSKNIKLENKKLDNKNFFNNEAYLNVGLGSSKWFGGNPDAKRSFAKVNKFDNNIDFEKEIKNYIIGRNEVNEAYELFSNIVITIKSQEIIHNVQSLTKGADLIKDSDLLTNPFLETIENNKGGTFKFTNQIEGENSNFYSDDISFNLNAELPFNNSTQKKSLIIFNRYFESRKTGWAGWGRDLAQSNLKLILTKENNSNIYNFEIGYSFYTDGDMTSLGDYDDPYLQHFLKSKNIEYNVKLPYSSTDLMIFKERFKQIMGNDLILSNVQSSIIFDNIDSSNPSNPNYGENEKKVREIFNKRIENFYDNELINNKIGSISKWDAKLNKFVNSGVTSIELEVPENVRGRRGEQQVFAKIKLTDKNSLFCFDEDKPTNEFKIPLKVYVQLAPNIDYSIDELVSIKPYESISNDYKGVEVKNDNLNYLLGKNEPDLSSISEFNININEINKYGDYNLIPEEKFPAINEFGTILKLKLKLKLGDYEIIINDFEFNRVFNNGRIYASYNLNNNEEYRKSSLKIRGNVLYLGLELKDKQLNIFNPSLIVIDNTNDVSIKNKFVSLNVVGASVIIPSEQVKTPSKWIQTKGSKNYEQSDGTMLRYVGRYTTYDPFHFRLEALSIPVFDPITGESVGYASKYKPYIREGLFEEESNPSSSDDDAIFPQPEVGNSGSYYYANLGQYVMKKKLNSKNGKINFQIVIKEYDSKTTSSNKYTKDRWIIDIEMNLLDTKAFFEMNGYQDNELIKNENEQKFFNEESEYYRGDFADQNTGMYIPKIVWVNAYPPETFLYDPRNENYELIEDGKFDVGYIAELNATAFVSEDYISNPSFGGYETNFDLNIFEPNGLIPYSEFYTFNKNSLIPLIERVALSQTGLQTIKSTSDFRQIVLKRPNSNNFLYQFVKISTRDEILKNKADIVSLYGSYKGLKNQPLFIDFWDTFHGKNLMKYLIDYGVFENEDKVKELEYNDVIQYWNIYVNDPSNSNNNSQSQSQFDISKLSLGYDIISDNNKVNIRNAIINIIENKLTNKIRSLGWIQSYEELKYNIHFRIEDNEEQFENKIKLLIDEYNKPLNEAKIITFRISIIDSAYENSIIKINGETSIDILNNKDANNIIDLSEYGNTYLPINSLDSETFNQNNIVESVKQYILKSIDRDFEKIINNSNIVFGEGFFPKLNRDYRLTYFVYSNGGNNIREYSTIEKAIRDVLLYNVESLNFDNNLFIRIEAIFNDESHFMKNSFIKQVNNNPNNINESFDSFDLSTIKTNDIKINTQHKDFPNDLDKTQTILKLLKERIESDINFWARNWIYTYKKEIIYGINYEIRFINEDGKYYDANNDEDFLKIINDVLVKGVENDQQFNRNLKVEVRAINDGYKNTIVKGKFIKNINNNYLNEAIESDDLDDDNINNDIINDSSSSIDLENKQGVKEKINLWWIITPITIFGILAVVVFVVIKVRRNRRIR